MGSRALRHQLQGKSLTKASFFLFVCSVDIAIAPVHLLQHSLPLDTTASQSTLHLYTQFARGNTHHTSTMTVTQSATRSTRVSSPGPSEIETYNIKNRVILTKEHLEHLNSQLADLSPQEIIEWSLLNFPDIYQTTAFGLTGLVTIDILSKMNKGDTVQLIFLDTLHHFPQTLDLVRKVQEKYPKNKLNIYGPKDCATEQDFADKYGEMLWDSDEDQYDFLVKVEPAQRAYDELEVVAVFTGRRRSQGGARNSLQILEVDETSNIIKINPMANWSFEQVLAYIKEHNVPYNELLDLGYRSVGDYHSTVPVAEGEDERAGRWKGRAKTECGIHTASKFAKFLNKEETELAKNDF